MSDDTSGQQVPEELKIDVDQEALAKWDAVSDDYAGEGEPEKHRPAFTVDSKSASHSDAPEADLMGTDNAGAAGETVEDETDSDSGV